MLYFAYGSNLNAKAVTDWCRHYGHRPPNLKHGKPALLNNYRLCFPIFSEYWAGGIGDVVYDPGKYVAGVLFDLPDHDLATMDAKVGRRTDAAGKEVGVYARGEVEVTPSGETKAVKAVTYLGVNVEKYHIPPTQNYMDLVVQGAYANGLSMMWISYLQSFTVQQARVPKPPGEDKMDAYRK